NWPDYHGLGKKYASMEWVIKDPAENPAPPDPAVPPVTPVLPGTVVSWLHDLHPLIYTDVQVINELRDPTINNPDFTGNTCWPTGDDPIVPASNSTEVKVEDLQPTKLYTAVVFNKYSKDGLMYQRGQVHSYPFQTSRYAN